MQTAATQKNIDVLQELDAGVFAEKFASSLAEVALGVVTTGKTGRITIQLDLKRIAAGSQVNVSHKLLYTRPTAHGKTSEENTTETPMYVGQTGALTIFPEAQIDFINAAKEAV